MFSVLQNESVAAYTCPLKFRTCASAAEMASAESAAYASASEASPASSADECSAAAGILVDFRATRDAVAAVAAYENLLDVVIASVACKQQTFGLTEFVLAASRAFRGLPSDPDYKQYDN